MLEVRFFCRTLSTPSPKLDPVRQTIKEYLEIHLQPNLTKLSSAIGESEMQTLLENTLQPSDNLASGLEIIDDPELKLIYGIIYRLFRGDLNHHDRIIQHIKNVDPSAELRELNKLIAEETQRQFKIYIDTATNKSHLTDDKILVVLGN